MILLISGIKKNQNKHTNNKTKETHINKEKSEG